MCCPLVPAPASTTTANMTACSDGIHKAGGELRAAKADGWCGGFGQEGRRINGSMASRQVGGVGIGMMAVKRLTSCALTVGTKLGELFGSRAG